MRYKRDLKIEHLYHERNDGFCWRCQKQLTNKQIKWCSKDCSYEAAEELMFAKGSSKHLRKAVFARDGGICASCGVDGEKLQRISDAANDSLIDFEKDINPFWTQNLEMSYEDYTRELNKSFAFAKQYFKSARLIWKNTALNFGGSCWQVDHIVEVVNGGKHEMENLQTLCNLCHKNKTAGMNRPSSNLRKRKANNVVDILPHQIKDLEGDS